jgi:hypothetical protein
MTEAEWLTCTEPGEMFWFLGDRISDGKLRLFGCACVRGVWEHLPEDALRQAIETCERFADGLATAEELAKARELARGTYQGIGDIIADHSAIAIEGLCRSHPWFPMGTGSSAGIAAVAAEVRFEEGISWGDADAEAKQSHSHLFREVFGNPFRPTQVNPAWVSWNDDLVTRLARSIYEERSLPAGTLDNTRLGVLADALEEAGCTDADLLAHLRSPGPHVRGCFALDLLLARE